MKKRQYLNQTNPTQNFDSFLDILTNTVGVLIFICLFVYLVAAQATNVIRTPMATDTNKTPKFFEVRDGRVYFLNSDEVQQKVERFAESLPQCYKPNIPDRFHPDLYDYYLEKALEYRDCYERKTAAIENLEIDTKYYDVFLSENTIAYKHKKNVEGEIPSQLTLDTSEFQTTLENINPETEFLAFLVKSDSYEAFRAARKIAWDLGFDVGWEPQTVDEPLIFSSGGRSIGIQ
ncbi:hypothetical protein [Myxosarcina sp. GI1]|uniref:hypothetical protein n=1 Tax=Myxosarcina sp. GI1 TaxID=1541065 RepID=UPI00056A38AE|nr:hypothetical protein [Myxosarcina sp. GI1]